MSKIIILVPCYNASKNILKLYESIREQSFENWEIHILNDKIDDICLKQNISKYLSDSRIFYTENIKRKYALRNISDYLDHLDCKNDEIIGIIDGDDCLCNINTFQMINDAYSNDKIKAVWTKHNTDGNSKKNICEKFPKKENPYNYKWVSSHFRTFRYNIFKQIDKSNFKDNNGDWFKRGYDQALMLPIIYLANPKNTIFIDKTCYEYNLCKSVSVKKRTGADRDQTNAVQIVRKRGYLSEKGTK